jgi:hypothetical protein
MKQGTFSKEISFILTIKIILICLIGWGFFSSAKKPSPTNVANFLFGQKHNSHD